VTAPRDPWVAPALADGRLGYLEVTGRRTGLPRRLHVGFARLDDGQLVIGCAHRATQWQYNLLAAPECRFEIKGDAAKYAARELTGPEREVAVAALVTRYADNAPRHRIFALAPPRVAGS
jgi:deazaflavin-dependent oxidoreductase (nitroreductase family)